MRGEYDNDLHRIEIIQGLSPRARGIRVCTVSCQMPAGSIPACAGNTFAGLFASAVRRVYPRVRGEYTVDIVKAACLKGLSPRARGIPSARPSVAAQRGSIPACAGNTGAVYDVIVISKVYPRVRGEYPCALRLSNRNGGLSPRARGIHSRLYRPFPCRGSIPACAGNTGCFP